MFVKSDYVVDPVGTFYCARDFGYAATFVVLSLDSLGKRTTLTTTDHVLNAFSVRVIYTEPQVIITGTTSGALEKSTDSEMSPVSSASAIVSNIPILSTSSSIPTSQPSSDAEPDPQRVQVGLIAGLGVAAFLCAVLGIAIFLFLKRYRNKHTISPEKVEEVSSYTLRNHATHQNIIWHGTQNQMGELDAERPVRELEGHYSNTNSQNHG